MNEKNIPLTLQEKLYNELSNQIKSGKYKPGDKIPSEPQLVNTYEISRVTVRNAIQQPVNDGVLIKKHGKGTFVKSAVYTEGFFSGGSFTETCLQMKATPYTHIISIDKEKADEQIHSILSEKNELVTIKRVRYVDDVPSIVEIDYFSNDYSFLLNENIENTSLMKIIIQKKHVIMSNFEDKFTISYANKEFSELLNIPSGTPLLEITQTVSSPDNQVVYINKQYILTSKYVYAVRSYK